ncbi:MAG: chain-length determining protein [Prevotellaceae bacterium]|jgi:uncharacterized protein involved in exopolysaccharide biosynthesis|nr:chain-length determining protein [Prevotellaceae bacterium]
MSDTINNTESVEVENEIDLIELIRKLWNKRWFIFKACCIGGVIGLIIAFSIPKEYTTTVILAPEINSENKGNMGALAATIGINLQQNTSEISPDLYPDIVKSTPFLLALLDLKVVDKEQEINTTLYNYLNDLQKKAWWDYIFSFPFQVLSKIHPTPENTDAEGISEKIISLTVEQEEVIKMLNKKISISVNKKTGVISLGVTMQSANISASIADTLSSYMQDYIIKYRTEKARQDLAFTQILYDESKQEYYNAQQVYANYIDKNQGIISASFRTTQERLQNEMNLAYNVYTQMAQQLQMAKIKVQDTTPVCKIIQPAVIPIKASTPKKILILMGFVFLAFLASYGWIFFVKDYIKSGKQ